MGWRYNRLWLYLENFSGKITNMEWRKCEIQNIHFDSFKIFTFICNFSQISEIMAWSHEDAVLDFVLTAIDESGEDDENLKLLFRRFPGIFEVIGIFRPIRFFSRKWIVFWSICTFWSLLLFRVLHFAILILHQNSTSNLWRQTQSVRNLQERGSIDFEKWNPADAERAFSNSILYDWKFHRKNAKLKAHMKVKILQIPTFCHSIEVEKLRQHFKHGPETIKSKSR